MSLGVSLADRADRFDFLNWSKRVLQFGIYGLSAIGFYSVSQYFWIHREIPSMSLNIASFIVNSTTSIGLIIVYILARRTQRSQAKALDEQADGLKKQAKTLEDHSNYMGDQSDILEEQKEIQRELKVLESSEKQPAVVLTEEISASGSEISFKCENRGTGLAKNIRLELELFVGGEIGGLRPIKEGYFNEERRISGDGINIMQDAFKLVNTNAVREGSSQMSPELGHKQTLVPHEGTVPFVQPIVLRGNSGPKTDSKHWDRVSVRNITGLLSNVHDWIGFRVYLKYDNITETDIRTVLIEDGAYPLKNPVNLKTLIWQGKKRTLERDYEFFTEDEIAYQPSLEDSEVNKSHIH